MPIERTPMRVFLGAAVLGGRRGLGPAIAPVLGVAVPLRYGFSLAGTTAGPFTRLVGDAGDRHGDDDAGAGRDRRPLRDSRSAPSARSRRSRPASTSSAPRDARPRRELRRRCRRALGAPLFAVGTGISVWFRRWLAATAQIETFYTQPMTDIIVSGVVVGRAGGPSLLAQVGLSVSLGER